MDQTEERSLSTAVRILCFVSLTDVKQASLRNNSYVPFQNSLKDFVEI